MKRPNASTTKIMTAILMIEKCKMTDTITASKSVCETPFTSLHLKPGEKILAKDLLVGMLVRSANDAAVAAAEHIARNVPAFVIMMNRKAVSIGCQHTHFVTPNGLYDKDHYSSAYDLCLMARYALQYPLFNEAVNTRKYYLNSRTLNKKDLAVFNNSKFLKDYPGADGVKSGYIKQAGYCYVGSATRNGWRLVSAVLKSDNASRDTAIVMDYVFSNFQPCTIARAGSVCTMAKIEGGSAATVAAAPVRDLTVPVPKTGGRVATRIHFSRVRAPILSGAKIGTIVASVNGRTVDIVELRALDKVEVSFVRRAWWWMKACGILIAGLMVVRKYGTAFAKNTRRRRRRVTTAMRGYNRYR
jgi:serine-type D-Ala-D-Ala carboxypeptidase (penicillin-binding protein 5/6)